MIQSNLFVLSPIIEFITDMNDLCLYEYLNVITMCGLSDVPNYHMITSGSKKVIWPCIIAKFL